MTEKMRHIAPPNLRTRSEVFSLENAKIERIKGRNFLTFIPPTNFSEIKHRTDIRTITLSTLSGITHDFTTCAFLGWTFINIAIYYFPKIFIMRTNKTKFFNSVGTLLLTCLLVVLPSCVMAKTFTVNGISYTTSGAGSTECKVSSQNKNLSGKITIPQNVKYDGVSYTVVGIKGYAFQYCSDITSITLPESVTDIGNYAFLACSSLVSITLPESLTNIGKCAFVGCNALSSLTIPASVTSIGDQAFSYCTSVTSIIVKEGNSVYDSRANCNAIIETESNTLVFGCSTTKIPESVTGIGGYAFRSCSSLTSITLPESLTSIGIRAFLDCSSLTNINIPESVTSIVDFAFMNCSSLTSIILPRSLTSIRGEVFKGCSSLTSINIPESVTEVGNEAFSGCFSLKEITSFAITPPLYAGSPFEKLETQNITLRVPKESVEAYKAKKLWSEFHIVGFDPSDIKGVELENGNPIAIYSLDGKRVNETQKGRIYLHRYGNGKTVKRMAK